MILQTKSVMKQIIANLVHFVEKAMKILAIQPTFIIKVLCTSWFNYTGLRIECSNKAELRLTDIKCYWGYLEMATHLIKNVFWFRNKQI